MENALMMLLGVPVLATLGLGFVCWFAGALRRESFDRKMAVAVLESGYEMPEEPTKS